MQKQIAVRIFMSQAMDDPQEFLGFVQHYCDSLPNYLPEKWGYSEPYKYIFDENILSALIPSSMRATDVGWKRSKPRFLGGFETMYRGKNSCAHATPWLTAAYKKEIAMDLIAYLIDSSVKYKPDFAMIDSYVDAYRDVGVLNQAAPYASGFIFATHTLRKWLPDFFWGTVFGPAYVRLIGKERLLSAPVFKAIDLGEELVYLQLTESIDDIYFNFEKVQQIREKVKIYLDGNIFFNADFSEDHVYDTPCFNLPS